MDFQMGLKLGIEGYIVPRKHKALLTANSGDSKIVEDQQCEDTSYLSRTHPGPSGEFLKRERGGIL